MAALALASFVPAASAQSAAGKPTVRICTGGQSGKYYQTAAELGSQLKGAVVVQVVETNGSLDNFRQLADGNCDAAIVQSDAYGIFPATNPAAKLNVERVVPLYNEYAQLVCNVNAGINDVDDLIGKSSRVLIGPNGSGTSVTWQTFGKQREDYLKVGTDPIGGTRAITRIVDGTDAACMIFVSGLGSGTMQEVDELGKGKLKLVPINDGVLDDVKDPKNQSVYTFADVPEGTYKNLQAQGWFGGQKNIQTLALPALLIANVD